MNPLLDEPLSVALLRTGWAATLSADELEVASRGTFDRIYPAGVVVAPLGEVAEHWIGVICGMVKVDTSLADGKSTTFIGVSTGGWLGEGSLLKRESRPYEVVALKESRIAFMSRPTFEWLYEHSLSFNHFLISQLNARLAQFISMVERSRMHSPTEIIAFGLASLLHPKLSPSPSQTLLISQEELGKLCGLSRQAANKGLHQLMEQGLIDVEYRAILVKDLEGLRSAARVVPGTERSD